MFLCIDTTTSAAGITLVGYGRLAIDLHHASEDILKKIDELVQGADIELSDLKGVFVIKGPGSFTGLRIGIAVANQFAHQLKIPIIGLRTDEWWSYRTDEKNFVYLQSMNKAEVYVAKFKTRPAGSAALSGARWSDLPVPDRAMEPAGSVLDFELKPKIIPIEKLSGKKLWLGQLSDEHRQKLPSGFKEITDLKSPEKTWEQITKKTDVKSQKTYDLIEPYYGKEPTITKSKKRLTI